MNKTEFMQQLERMLQDVPQMERIEALQYYNDYFEDAGEDQEKDVIAALGNPYKVAENIKKGLYQNHYNFTMEQEKVAAGRELVNYQPAWENETSQQKQPQKSGLSTGMIALIVVLVILALPILMVLGCIILALLITVVVVWGSIVAGLGAISLVSLIVGIFFVGIGFAGLITNPQESVGILGAGFLALAIGLVVLLLVVLFVGKLTPAIWKGLVWIVRVITGKNKKRREQENYEKVF